MGRLEVPNPCEGAAPVPESATIGKQAAPAEDGVSSAVHGASFHIDGPIGLQRVSVADNMDTLQGDAFPVDKQALGLAPEVRREGDVPQDKVRAMVEGHGRPPLREGPGPLVRLHGHRMRIEDLVVGIMHPGHIGTGTKNRDVGLIADIDNLLIVAGQDPDDDWIGRPIRDEIQCPLKRREVSLPGSIDRNRVLQGRNLTRGRESPFRYAFESAGKDLFVNGYPIRPPVLQHIVMRINHGRIAADQDRMEVKCIREAADNRQLVIRRRRFGHTGRGAGHGVSIGGNEVPVVIVRNFRIINIRSIGTALRRPGRHRHIQAIHTFSRPCVVYPNPPARSDNRLLRKRKG